MNTKKEKGPMRMRISPPSNVMECDAAGNYYWLVVSDILPFAATASSASKNPPNEASIWRKIERWCLDEDVLGPYAFKATPLQIAQLVEAARISGFPPKDKGLFLVHRDGLASIHARPTSGWQKGKKRRAEVESP